MGDISLERNQDGRYIVRKKPRWEIYRQKETKVGPKKKEKGREGDDRNKRSNYDLK